MKLMDALIGKKLILGGDFTHADIEKFATQKEIEPGVMLLDGWAAQQPEANFGLLATILSECGIDYSCLGGTIKKEAVEVLYGSGTSCVAVNLRIFDVVLFLVLSVVSGFTKKKKDTYCNRRNFRTRFNFVHFVLLAVSTKISSTRKLCACTGVCDTALEVRKFIAYESSRTLEHEIFTRT